MKRIEALIQGAKSLFTPTKIRKIERAVESAIDQCKEDALIAEENAQSCLQKLEAAETAEEIACILKQSIEFMRDAEDAKANQAAAEKLKAHLNEKVDVNKK